MRSNFPGARVSRNVLAALVKYRPIPGELSPNLRRFNVGHGESLALEDLPFLQCLLGPSISVVDIYVAAADDHICGLLWSMSRTSPYLHEISIISHEEDINPENALALSGLLLSLTEIEIIQVMDMPLPARAVVDHLGTLSSLRFWEYLAFPPSPDIHSFTTRGGRFSNLCHFGFSIMDLMTAAAVVESMACPFEHLNIRICQSRPWVMTETVRSLRRMTEVLSRHQSWASLSRLGLRVMPDMVADGDSVHAALRPLFRLNGIRHLTLYLSIFNKVGDSWLDEASQSWPHLEILRVALPYRPIAQQYQSEESLRPTMTLAGLIPMLRRCPNLRNLDISLVAKPLDLSLLSGISSSNTIYQVCFPASAIESPSEVFDCIVLMFPHLRRFKGFSYRWGSDDSAAWRDLSLLILDIPGYAGYTGHAGSQWESWV